MEQQQGSGSTSQAQHAGPLGLGPNALQQQPPDPGGGDPTGPGQHEQEEEEQTDLRVLALPTVWQRLWDAPAGNRARIMGWRLAHGSIPCGLYMAAHGRGGEEAHLCTAQQCRESGQRSKPRDSLTHIFVQCPRYAAAREWLRSLWRTITGEYGPGPPVDNAGVMLADCPFAWPGYPSAYGLVRLWSALRLLLLHAIWCAHCAADASHQSPRAVVRQVVQEARRLMRCQFGMAALVEETMDRLPTCCITAQFKPSSLADFEACWAAGGVLCSVLKSDGRERPKIRIFLTESHPVPLPEGP